MHPERFESITAQYAKLRVALVGDVCLDRYLEIDPAREEISIETGLPVHNVVRVRSQPGAAGTILNNLAALGVGEIYPVGFAGEDGEGYELRRALSERAGVRLDHFLETSQRRTFTYCKPLVMYPGRAPQELNRLDSKNWSPTPLPVQESIVESIRHLATHVHAIILMDQVDVEETGVVTREVLELIGSLAKAKPELLILADSRRGLQNYPSVCFKMNEAELARLAGTKPKDIDAIQATARALAQKQGRQVFVTMAERGICGASPNGRADHVPALPVQGEIDIVGAGDAVTANLTAALAGGANLKEALVLANSAASIVIHQLGTTGTASVQQLRHIIFPS
ncbi:MAG TPA: PfkB family carbohydrate kinase [Verrucomicrobiae bacterium]